MTKEKIAELNDSLKNATPQDVINFFGEMFGNRIALSTSLGAEDQVLTEMVANSSTTNIKIFTLDTGRLFPETYDLIDRTSKRYKRAIEIYFPQHDAVESMVLNKGMNLFFESVENRKECCNTRKIEPLTRAFKSIDAWICGLRAEQSITRTAIEIVEWDLNNNKLKINPLAHWTEKMVWDYIKEKKIPYNPLHDKGFPSIGCQPCTRAIMDGEDVRAGRWWWENPTTKECGLHKK